MATFSRFVNLLKSEEAGEQVVLIIDSQIASKAETLLEPQHRFETRNRSARRIEGLETADLRLILLYSKVVTLGDLLKMLDDIMNRIRMQEPVIDSRLDR